MHYVVTQSVNKSQITSSSNIGYLKFAYITKITAVRRFAMSRPVIISLIIFSIFCTWSNKAYAYIDPTAGGLMLQFLFGALAGIFVVIKLKWHWLKDTIFNRIKQWKVHNGKNTEE